MSIEIDSSQIGGEDLSILFGVQKFVSKKVGNIGIDNSMSMAIVITT